MRVAAIDLGSNSFHLIVAEVLADGTFDPIVREKEMLRIGDVVSRSGHIPELAADAVVATVRRFRLIAESTGAREIAACGTAALRLAANSGTVVDRIEAEAGVAVEVISGRREAELIFGAIRAAVVLEPPPALCFDLGGGSVELMVGDASGLAWAASENLGVARLTAEFVQSDPISKHDRRAVRRFVRERLEPLAPAVADLAPGIVVGSSGTLESLARMIISRRDGDVPRSVNHVVFGRAEFEALADDLLAGDAATRLRVPGLEARRVDLIAAGILFLETAMDVFGFDELVISEWALREGILLDVIRRHDPIDWSDDPRAIRTASVEALGRRCSWPEAHARHVAALALALFDQTRDLHGLGPEDREILEAAALLHDIGEHVASEGHHRHGAYLIEHGQLRGFDPTEIQVIAAVTRWHRRGTPDPGPDHPLADPGRVQRITALLRLADGLDRGRAGAVAGVEVAAGPSLVLIRPLARADAELEVWGARRKRELFERIFGRDVEITHPRAVPDGAPTGSRDG